MALVKRTIICVFFLTFSWTLNRAEVCILKDSCIFPCSFKQGDEVVIHWKKLPANTGVHSYYYNQNRLEHQDQHFRGRTWLFQNQISEGNASLRLTGVTLQDRGRYKCYTSTISGSKESFIDINVEAPPHKVTIEQVGNRITCSSEGIYPEPELTWSTSPPSPLTGLAEPTVQPTEQQLYSISSSLTAKDDALEYSCTVSAGSNKRTATLFNQTSIIALDAKTTIPCTSSNIPPKSFVWTFNHSQNILIQTKASVSEEWRKYVKDVSESGGLILQDLTPEQEGVYTCELSTAEETYVSNTVLSIEKSQGTSKAAGITAGVLIPFLVVITIIIIIIIYKRFKKNRTSEKWDEVPQSQQLNVNHEATQPVQESTGQNTDKFDEDTDRS